VQGVKAATVDNESQLWVMAAIAFSVFYSNYMVPPLIPALSVLYGLRSNGVRFDEIAKLRCWREGRYSLLSYQPQDDRW
jgi:hypothetical protein